MSYRRSPRPAHHLFLVVFAVTALAGSGLLFFQGTYRQVLGVSTRDLAPTHRPVFRVNVPPWSLTSRNTVTPTDVQATALILVDEDTGTILAQRQADTRRPMASTTKIMTAALALEFLQPDSVVTIPKEALAGLPDDSALMGITPNEQYTVKELLYGALLPSGNDAAQALAIAVSGSQAKFVQLMNAKAQQLGLKNTHFTNAAGLDDPQHYSSARDLAMIAHYARTFPLFRQIAVTPSITLPYSTQHKELYLENFNSLITMYPGATGIKPGNTGDAGNCLVASATRDGHDLIGVLLDTPGRNTNMIRLLDLGFSSY